MPLTITFIRHGESLDNIAMVYGGWKDAPLSPLGERQASALGVYFSTSSPTAFSHIYSSDLQRAHQTAIAVQQATNGPAIATNTDLRERHWGVAEGKPYGVERQDTEVLEDLLAKGVYPILRGREEKFPEGESFADVHVRAEKAIRGYLAKHLAEEKDANIAIASHGLCIGELVSALIRMDPEADQRRNFTGLRNTAWHRAVVSVKAGSEKPKNAQELPALNVEVTHEQQAHHLNGLLNENLEAFDKGIVVKAPAIPVGDESAQGLAAAKPN